MSGWNALADLGVIIRPLEHPELAGGYGDRSSPFFAKWGETIQLLARELRMLEARHIVLQADFRERDLRVDGLPRANARLERPGVVLAFDSKYGPQQYPCAEFYEWQDNVRAVALSLEALRKVDRYGVSKRGEQYRGWKALPVSTDPADAIQTAEQARAFLAQWDGDARAALLATHPDRGGDPDEFRKVVRARELVGA